MDENTDNVDGFDTRFLHASNDLMEKYKLNYKDLLVALKLYVQVSKGPLQDILIQRYGDDWITKYKGDDWITRLKERLQDT